MCIRDRIYSWFVGQILGPLGGGLVGGWWVRLAGRDNAGCGIKGGTWIARSAPTAPEPLICTARDLIKGYANSLYEPRFVSISELWSVGETGLLCSRWSITVIDRRSGARSTAGALATFLSTSRPSFVVSGRNAEDETITYLKLSPVTRCPVTREPFPGPFPSWRSS
eukprot:TRINITY_DN10564_c0_g2_i2.p2 TRINITY_DN10564_c0_g2~~TRINITY_DN10564_c0_g2_i2.p2  ORF type:complete len:167 (+),score=8.16 TRINITY_DN10564_c0_g2_i2:112-612(+)